MIKQSIIAVYAKSMNNVIGNENKLPWHIPSDLKKFKELTKDSIVIMGSNTLKSIGKLLPNRWNIIISADESKKEELKNICHTSTDSNTPYDIVTNPFFSLIYIKEFSKLFPELAQDRETFLNNPIFIIGGSQIFNEFLPVIDKIYETYILHKVKGDKFIQANFTDNFNLISKSSVKKEKDDQYSYEDRVYER